MYTLKVFNSFFGGSTAIKIDEIRNIQIERVIDSFDILNIEVDYYVDPELGLNCSGLRQFQRVQVIQSGLQDSIVFEGYIYNLQPNFKSVKLVCRDYKGLLDRKKLFSAKNYASKSLDFILNEIFTELNGRSAGDTNPEAWAYTIDTNPTITKDFDKWYSYFSVLQDLGVIADKNFKVENGVVIMADIIGTDKTTGEEFTELIYNKDGPDENNIGNISVNSYGTIATTILTSSTSVTDTPSKDLYGRLEDYNDISGDELTNELSTLSKEQKIHKFDVDFNSLLQLGDKIAVEINSGIEFLDTTGSLFVTRIKTEILGGAIITVNIDVSEITIKKTGLIKTVNDLQAEVKKLQL